jgi:hypothetical protein
VAPFGGGGHIVNIQHFKIDPNLLIDFVIPPLIFEAMMNVDYKQFKPVRISALLDITKDSIFVDGTKPSDAGILNKLFDFEPKYLLIDEIEKMNVLLNLLETGVITSTLKNDPRTIKLDTWMFATCNDIEKLQRIEPSFLPRLQCLRVDAYNEEQFKTITVQRLKREKIETELAQYIADRVFDMGSTNVRDCIYLARMAKTQDDVDRRFKTLKDRHVDDGGNTDDIE